jgi:hypothetical protein
MGLQDLEVTGIDDRPLNARCEKLLRAEHEVLVKWSVKCNVYGKCLLLTASCSTRLLPQRRNSAWKSKMQCKIKRSNVNA